MYNDIFCSKNEGEGRVFIYFSVGTHYQSSVIYKDMMIGVMDSGIGGLHVLASLIKHRCGDRYLYLADGANLPYGEKSPSELREIAWRGACALVDRGADVIVFGCNTLSVVALDHVRKRVTPPVFGLLPRPDLCAGRSLMMTTPATALFLPKLESNVSLLTPLSLASLIDGAYPDERRMREYLRPLLLPYRDSETVYLGCSHYLYVESIVKESIPRARILNGVDLLAGLVAAILPSRGSRNPCVDFLFTGREEQERYCSLLAELLG